VEAGFIGGLIAGLLAGGIVLLLKSIPAQGTLKRMMPILVYPILGTLAVGMLMLLVVGEPVATVNAALSDWLQGMSGANQIVLGLIIGLMMAFDMGGPVNKVAYAFGLLSLEAGNLQIMAAVMAAGMTPPLGMALATVLALVVGRRLGLRMAVYTGSEAKGVSVGEVRQLVTGVLYVTLMFEGVLAVLLTLRWWIAYDLPFPDALYTGTFHAISTITPFTLDQILFEATSAFATVGLSTGITGDLPVPGQLILVFLMFVGRIGPITLASALAMRRRSRGSRNQSQSP
jgi:Trk-type K+ transport system membrane component